MYSYQFFLYVFTVKSKWVIPLICWAFKLILWQHQIVFLYKSYETELIDAIGLLVTLEYLLFRAISIWKNFISDFWEMLKSVLLSRRPFYVNNWLKRELKQLNRGRFFLDIHEILWRWQNYFEQQFKNTLKRKFFTFRQLSFCVEEELRT